MSGATKKVIIETASTAGGATERVLADNALEVVGDPVAGEVPTYQKVKA